MEKLTRRSFIGGLIAAPAIVAYGNIMPVKSLILPAIEPVTGYMVKASERMAYAFIDRRIVEREIVRLYGYDELFVGDLFEAKPEGARRITQINWDDIEAMYPSKS